MSEWLNEQEAIRLAFKGRNRWAFTDRCLTDDYLRSHPILITDFDRSKLRMIEVKPGDWNDYKTWSATERPMTDKEARYLDWWSCNPERPENKIGAPIGAEGEYQTIGYINRPSRDEWMILINVDQVNGTMGYEH